MVFFPNFVSKYTFFSKYFAIFRVIFFFFQHYFARRNRFKEENIHVPRFLGKFESMVPPFKFCFEIYIFPKYFALFLATFSLFRIILRVIIVYRYRFEKWIEKKFKSKQLTKFNSFFFLYVTFLAFLREKFISDTFKIFHYDLFRSLSNFSRLGCDA